MNKEEIAYGDIRHVRCPICGHHNFMFRSKTFDYRCKTCGTIFVINYEDQKFKARVREEPI